MAFSWTDLPKLLDIRKVPAQIWLAVALATGAIIFVPAQLAQSMGLDALRGGPERTYIGAVFVLASAMLVAQLLTYFGSEALVLLIRWRGRRQIHYLAPDQKALLKRYIDEDVGVLYLEFNDAVAEGLETMGLLDHASRFDVAIGLGFAIKPWLRVHLKKNPTRLSDAATPRERDSDY